MLTGSAHWKGHRNTAGTNNQSVAGVTTHLRVTSVPMVNTVGPLSAPGSTSSTSVVRGRSAELRSHHLVTCTQTEDADEWAEADQHASMTVG
jgi:hypothetical protein